MKVLYVLAAGLLIMGCNRTAEVRQSENPSYAKTDLRKISWIEGNWRGMDGENPFYEIYEITNDSTLKITSYSWNGTDSAESSVSMVQWDNGTYYLGADRNWKVTSITSDSIYMLPNNKAANTILWKRNIQGGWDAILKASSGSKRYQMERINHFNGVQ